MGWIASFAAALIVGLATIGQSAAADPPRVTVIGDSVLTAVEWNATPLSILEQGLDLQLDIGVCRTLEGVSCPFEGGNVPTLLDVVNTLGSRLGATVLVEVGYNDPANEFAQRVEDAIDALLAAGVQRILWANMREWQQQYIGMNQILAAAAARHPQLTVIDWEGYSHDHYSWFQGDGIHLVYDGAVAMATLFNAAIKQALAPAQQQPHPPPVEALTIAGSPLPVAHVGRPYSARLAAKGECPLQVASHLGTAAKRHASSCERAHHGQAPPAGPPHAHPASRRQPRRAGSEARDPRDRQLTLRLRFCTRRDRAWRDRRGRTAGSTAPARSWLRLAWWCCLRSSTAPTHMPAAPGCRT